MYVGDDYFDRALDERRAEFENKIARTLAPGRRRESEMRIFVASLVVLAVLYFWDLNYNNGKLLDGLESMRRSIAHHMFP